MGTAIDVLAMRGARLVVLELKTGFHGRKDLPAKRAGAACSMGAPLARAKDCVLHRHFAQLAATRHLFVEEPGTLGRETPSWRPFASAAVQRRTVAPTPTVGKTNEMVSSHQPGGKP